MCSCVVVITGDGVSDASLISVKDFDIAIPISGTFLDVVGSNPRLRTLGRCLFNFNLGNGEL